MPVSKNIKIMYDTVNPLVKWRPRIGDWVYYSGWIKHWVGFVAEKSNDDQQVRIIKSTLHSRIFTMGPKEQDKNMITLDVNEIKGTKCTYAIDQINGGNRVWYA
jgi:hypothetical protein